jgi:hypothetical protein
MNRIGLINSLLDFLEVKRKKKTNTLRRENQNKYSQTLMSLVSCEIDSLRLSRNSSQSNLFNVPDDAKYFECIMAEFLENRKYPNGDLEKIYQTPTEVNLIQSFKTKI